MKTKGWRPKVAPRGKGRMPLFLIALVLVFAGPSWAQAASLLKAGVARVNLTPPMEMKAALGGYGARMSKPAIGVHDAVWAKRSGSRRHAHPLLRGFFDQDRFFVGNIVEHSVFSSS